jgi:hypothetical protein
MICFPSVNPMPVLVLWAEAIYPIEEVSLCQYQCGNDNANAMLTKEKK